MVIKSTIADLVVAGYTNGQIAETVGFSVSYVKKIVSQIITDYKADSRIGLVRKVINSKMTAKANVLIAHCPRCLDFSIRRSKDYSNNKELVCKNCQHRFLNPIVFDGSDHFKIEYIGR